MKSNYFTNVPYIKLNASNLCFYSCLEPSPATGNRNINSLSNLEDNRAKGILSYNAKKRLKNCLINWTNALEFKRLKLKKGKQFYKNKMTFATLTLSAQQMHGDKEIKREMLNYFDISIKNRYPKIKNIWVAEKQENQNIHFHILYNEFIDYNIIKGLWNNAQAKTGYIARYRENQKEFHKNGFKIRKKLINKWSLENQYKAYLYGIKTDWSNPNSTDIHNLEKINNISFYMTKYMTKGFDSKVNNELEKRLKNEPKSICKEHLRDLIINEFKEKYKVEGKIWGRSNEFLKVRNFVDIFDSDYSNLVDELLNLNNILVNVQDNFTTISNYQPTQIKQFAPKIYKRMEDFYLDNYNTIYA